MKPDPAHIATDKEIAALERRLANEYQQATVEMMGKQEAALKQYERDRREMEDRLRRGTISESQMKSWRLEQAVSNKRNEDMVATLAHEAMEADRRAAEIINGQLPKTYATNFNYGTYQIESVTRIDTAFTLYDGNAVAALLRENPRLFKRAAVDAVKDAAWIKQHLSSALVQAILQGDPIDRLAARLMSVFEMDYNAAVRLARTTMTGAQNAGRLDSYERAQRLGIKGRKRWVSTTDDRTRETHLDADGQTVAIDEPFIVGAAIMEYPGDEGCGDPGEYMNCRCTIIFEPDGFGYDTRQHDLEVQERKRLNDGDPMSFDEWLDAHLGF